MTLHEGDTIKYGVTYRFGNQIITKEFASRENALEFANSFGTQHCAKWITLQTLERIK